MSYHYGGDLPGMAGQYHYGTGGLGVLGSMVPGTGTHGAGYGYSSLSLPADANKEYLFPITAVPAGLTIAPDEDSSFAASANDGTYVVPFDVIEGGVNIGSSSFTLTFGAGSTNLVGAGCTQAAISGTGAITVTPPAAGSVNLAGSSSVQAARCSVGALTVASGAGGSVLVDALLLSASRTVVFQGGSRVVNFGTESQNAGSATDGGPYFEGGKWWINKDADDQRYYVGNVAKDLTDSGTTAVSFEPVVAGVTVLESGPPQGTLGELLVVKLGGMGADGADSFCTFRVTCANTEQFDRTVHFKKVDN